MKIIELLILVSMQMLAQSAPIKNGFTVKLNPIASNEDFGPNAFSSLFAKIPQELKPTDLRRKEILSKAFFPYSAELGTGCTNQIAKLVYPTKHEKNISGSTALYNVKLINLPLLQQPYADYKILVATAPPDVKLGGPEAKDLVVYVVFPEDGLGLASPQKIPKVFFVNERNGKMDIKKKERLNPVFLVDSNRTVTGLKSNAVSKFVRFKNKVINRNNYV